jgi:type VI secretion system protein VasJ
MSTKLYDLGTVPISDDEPAGHDVTYEDDYNELTAEIKKLSSPTADSAIDWSKVKELASAILAGQSKNLQVACYLSVALGQIDGLKGCAAGVHILSQLLVNYWDSMYPPRKRKKGRINALAWWSEKMQALFESMEIEYWDSDSRRELIDDFNAMDDFLADHLPDGPILRPIIQQVSGLVLEKQDQEAQRDDGAGAEEPSQPSSPASTSRVQEKQTGSATAARAVSPAPVPPTPDSDEEIDADAFFASGTDFLAQAARKFFAGDPENPLGYQLNRLAAWGSLTALPPAASGKTMLPPPDEQLVTLLHSQFESGLWEALLNSAESYVRQHLFWLDLSYWVATALDNIQAPAASMAVAADTLLLVTRLRGLDQLAFSDGTPFASDETRDWLDTLRNPGGQDSVSRALETRSGETQGLDAALGILADQGIGPALSAFRETADVPSGGRESFLHELALCSLLLKGRQPDSALSFALRLLDGIDSLGLETWEPELALEGLLVVYRCFKQVDNQELKERIPELHQRITVIDPEKGIALTPAG